MLITVGDSPQISMTKGRPVAIEDGKVMSIWLRRIYLDDGSRVLTWNGPKQHYDYQRLIEKTDIYEKIGLFELGSELEDFLMNQNRNPWCILYNPMRVLKVIYIQTIYKELQ